MNSPRGKLCDTPVVTCEIFDSFLRSYKTFPVVEYFLRNGGHIKYRSIISITPYFQVFFIVREFNVPT